MGTGDRSGAGSGLKSEMILDSGAGFRVQCSDDANAVKALEGVNNASGEPSVGSKRLSSEP